MIRKTFGTKDNQNVINTVKSLSTNKRIVIQKTNKMRIVEGKDDKGNLFYVYHMIGKKGTFISVDSLYSSNPNLF